MDLSSPSGELWLANPACIVSQLDELGDQGQ
jgi:hypothetical protein